MSRFGAEGGFPIEQGSGTRTRDGDDPSARQARPDLPEDRRGRTDQPEQGPRRNDGNQPGDDPSAQRRAGVDDPSTRASRPDLPAERRTDPPTWARPSDLGAWGKLEHERPEHHPRSSTKAAGDTAGSSAMQPGFSWQRAQAGQQRERADTAKHNADVKKHANDKPRRFG